MTSNHLLVGLIISANLEAERVGLNKEELLTLHNPTGALSLAGKHANAVSLLAQIKYVIDDGAEEYGAIGPLISALNVGPLVKDILRVMVNQYHAALVAIHEEGDGRKKAPHVLVVGKVARHRHVERVDKDDAGLALHGVYGGHERLEIFIDVERQKFLRQMNKARIVQWDGVRHVIHSVYEVGAFPLSLDVEDVYRAGHCV